MQFDEISSSDILLRRDIDAVRILEMNRPRKHNALNSELTEALRDAISNAANDHAIRAIVLAGRGESFCAGADLSEFKDLTPQNSALVHARAKLTCELHVLLQKVPKPIVAAAYGNALGGGAGLAIGCDMLVAAPSLRLGFPEIRHSIVPALVMTGLQRQLSRKLAFEMISLGRLLNGDEAVAAGLVNVLCAEEVVLGTAIEIANRLARANPMAMAATKELFYRVADLPFEAAMATGRDVNALMRSFRETGS